MRPEATSICGLKLLVMLRCLVGGGSALQAAPQPLEPHVEISEQSRQRSDPTRATRTSQLTHLAAALTKPPDLFPSFPPLFFVFLFFFQAAVSDSPSQGSEGGSWEDWAPADDKWRELLKNDPFAKSSLGGDV